MSDFNDKVVVITGAAQGIGRCIADDFMHQGALVVVIDIEAIKEANYAYTFKGDIADKAVLEVFVQTVIERFGHIDYLVNNACMGRGGLFTAEYEDFLYVQRVGVVAPFILSKLFTPYFRAQGSIINIASTRAFQSQSNTECYSTAKGGIIALTHALAVSLRGKVRVNAISPGWIDTGSQEGLSKEDHAQHLVGRVGHSQDISHAVQFLCSDKASFITGQNIIIDGGMSKLMTYHNDEGWHFSQETFESSIKPIE